MKVTSTIASPYFFYPGTSSRRRTVRRPVAVRVNRPALIETSDELARKQEIVCGAILGLSLVSSVVVCFWQLAVALNRPTPIFPIFHTTNPHTR